MSFLVSHFNRRLPPPFLILTLTIAYRTYFRSVFAGTLLLKKSEDGSDLNGSRLTVQFARGARQRNEFAGPPERPHPRPRRTAHRMQITGLPGETSWQVSTF